MTQGIPLVIRAAKGLCAWGDGYSHADCEDGGYLQ
jgi:Cys-tRNA synthase (O-phospho-L-seryl-tRNA:Cys-tRNA synthase)